MTGPSGMSEGAHGSGMSDRPFDVVLGANGPVGTHLVDLLVAKGRTVKAASRRGDTPVRAGVTSHKVDASDVEALTALLRGAHRCFATIGVEYTKWPELFPPIIVSLLAACKATSTPLVWCDNLYMYGPQSEPLREDMPLTTYGRKPAIRAQIARQMQEHHDAGHSPVAMVRASDFYGPLVRQSLIGEGFVDKLVAGQAALLLPNPNLPHTFTYVVDFARAMMRVGDDMGAYGRAWHVPNAPPLSVRQVLEMVAAEAGVQPKASVLPSCLLTMLAPVVPIMREVKDMQFQRTVPYYVDDAAFRVRYPDFTPTPFADGVKATVAWYKEQAAGAAKV